jgi:hypothetical protein
MALRFLPGAHALDVRSFETNASNKFDPHFGVESLGAEMHLGRWEFPCPCLLTHDHDTGKNCRFVYPEADVDNSILFKAINQIRDIQQYLPLPLRFLIDNMVQYSPLEHSGDYLMSAWIGREGVRLGMGEVQWDRSLMEPSWL